MRILCPILVFILGIYLYPRSLESKEEKTASSEEKEEKTASSEDNGLHFCENWIDKVELNTERRPPRGTESECLLYSKRSEEIFIAQVLKEPKTVLLLDSQWSAYGRASFESFKEVSHVSFPQRISS